MNSSELFGCMSQKQSRASGEKLLPCFFICLPYFSLNEGALGLRAVSEPVIPLSFRGTVPVPACSLPGVS